MWFQLSKKFQNATSEILVLASRWVTTNSPASSSRTTSSKSAPRRWQRLKADILAWYRRDFAANPDRPQYPLPELDRECVGNASRPKLARHKSCWRRIWCAASLPHCHRKLSFFLLGKPWSGIFRSLGARPGTCLLLLPWIPKHHLMLHMVFG